MGRGVLRPDLAASVLRLDRHKPTDALAPFVDYYWIVRWDLRGQPPHEQTVLPHPNVHLVFEASGAGIFGVDRRLFTRSLSGLGLAFGVRFTAGGFRPFWQAPISQLTDRVVPAARLFGPRAEKTRQAIMVFGGFDVDDGVMIGYAEALLHSVLPERDPLAEPGRRAGRAHHRRSRAAPGRPAGRFLRDDAAHPAAAVRRLRRGQPQVGDAPGPAARGRRARRQRRAGGLGRAGLGSRLRRPGPPDQGLHRDHRGAAGPLRGRSVTGNGSVTGPALEWFGEGRCSGG